MRTEHHLRRPSSPAVLLRARMRAGEVSQELVEARAYLGDEVARKVCGDVCLCPGGGTWVSCDEAYARRGNLSEWTEHLTTLLSRLPEWPVEVACPECQGSGEEWGRGPCDEPTASSKATCCNGTGKLTRLVPAARYLSVVGCVAVARACLEECEECTPACGCAEARICASQHPYPIGTTCPDCQDAVEVAESAECWLADPSEGNARAAAGHHPNQPWGDVGSLLLNPPLEMSPGAFWRACVPVLLESATLIDARAVFCAAVLKTLKESAE